MSVTPYAAPPQTTPWVPLWPLGGQTMGELAYAENTANTSVTATTEGTAQVVVTAPAITCDGVTPIIIQFQSPYIQPASVVGAAVTTLLFEDGVSLGVLGLTITPAAGGLAINFHAHRRRTPSAGAHTYTIRAYQSGGTGTVGGGLGGAAAYHPASIRISLAAPISTPIVNTAPGVLKTGVKAIRNASQSISNTTETPIVFDETEDFDTDNFHNPASNPSRITIPAGLGGVYQLLADTSWSNNTTGDRVIYLKKNGTVYLATVSARAGANFGNQMQVPWIGQLAAGDYVEMSVYQVSGAPLTTTPSSLVAVRL